MLLAPALNCKFRPAADSQSRIRAAAVFPKAVRESVNSILLVGGTLVFFVVAVRLFEASGIVSLLGRNELQKGTLFGLLEMTNGIKILSAEPVSRLSLVLTCGLMSFGGLCIFLQTCGVVNLRPVGYFAAKLFHVLLSAALCAAMYPLFFSKRRTGIHFDGGICGHCRKHNDDCTNRAAMPVFLLHIRTRARVCRQKHEDMN